MAWCVRLDLATSSTNAENSLTKLYQMEHIAIIQSKTHQYGSRMDRRMLQSLGNDLKRVQTQTNSIKSQIQKDKAAMIVGRNNLQKQKQLFYGRKLAWFTEDQIQQQALEQKQQYDRFIESEKTIHCGKAVVSMETQTEDLDLMASVDSVVKVDTEDV